MTKRAKIVQAIKIWIVIYPSITVFNILFGNYLTSLPLLLKTLVLTIILVPWMVFIGLPFINKVQQKVSKNEKP